MEFYVGTLTREGGEGILRCKLNGKQLERTGLISGVTDPNYLILRPDGKRLYAVSSDAEEGPFRGCVNEYDLTAEQPKLISRQPVSGNAPCHLTLSPDGRYLYCANYGTGSLTVFPVEAQLQPAVQVIRHEGRGPHPTRQTGPHVHQVTFLPDSQILCAADLGTEALYLYDASPADGCLTLRTTVPLHGGPRHVAYGNEDKAYLVHELSNEITVLRIENGAVTPLQTLSTLPEGYEGTNTAAAVRISPRGDRVYVSNRGHGSIAVFTVENTGLLRLMGHVPAGIFPRDFILLPEGGYLVADQRSGVLLLDEQGETVSFLPQMGAVCIAPCADRTVI